MFIKEFNPLLNSSYACLYCLISPSSLKFQVRSTNNLSEATYRLLQQYTKGLLVPQELSNDIYNGSLEINVLETLNDHVSRNLRVSFWVDYYLGLGYTLYKDQDIPKYKLSYDLKDLSEDGQFKYRAFLYLECASSKLLIGVFDTIEEMRKFKDKYYPKDEVKSLVYAFNEATRDALSVPNINLSKYVKKRRRKARIIEL